MHGSSAENEAKWHPKAHLSRRKRVVAKKLVHVNIIWKPVTFVTHTQCMRTPSPRDLSRRGALWSEASYTGLGSLNGAASELGRFRNLQTFWGGGVRVLHRGTPSRGSHCSSTALHTCPLTRRTHTCVTQLHMTGPRGARQRSHKLDSEAAKALVKSIYAASSGVSEAPLGTLASLLAAAHRGAFHSIMDDIPPTVTIYSMGEVLRWRAHALLVKPLSPPVEQWEDRSVWPAEFVTAVRITWRSILRTASQRKKTGMAAAPSVARPRHMHSTSQHQPNVPARQRAPTVPAPRPPAVGNLPCAFPDRMGKATPLSQKRISQWQLPSNPAMPNALHKLVPTRDVSVTSTLPTGREAAKLKEIRSWRLARALKSSRAVVFSIGQPMEAPEASLLYPTQILDPPSTLSLPTLPNPLLLCREGTRKD